MAPSSAIFSSSGIQVFFQSRRAGIDAQLPQRLAAFIGATKVSLDCAIYDLRHPAILKAFADLAKSGKKLRIAYHGAEQATAQALSARVFKGHTYAIHPTGNHLMHNKFLVRDGKSIWTGSANFTVGGLELQDNNCLAADSAPLAKLYAGEFDKLIGGRTFVVAPSASGTVKVGADSFTPFFAPGAQEGIEQQVVKVLQGARRVRVMAFLMSDPGILAAIARFRLAGSDIRGVYDPNGMKDGLGKKPPDPSLYWFLNDQRFVKAPSHAFNKNREQDFMHNKAMVIDDRIVVTGSYNFSENAEANDENIVIIDSGSLAQAYTRYFEAIYKKYGGHV